MSYKWPQVISHSGQKGPIWPWRLAKGNTTSLIRTSYRSKLEIQSPSSGEERLLSRQFRAPEVIPRNAHFSPLSDKAAYASSLVFGRKGQIKDTHTLRLEKRLGNAFNTPAWRLPIRGCRHAPAYARQVNRAVNMTSGTQHQDTWSGRPRCRWEACGAEKPTCSPLLSSLLFKSDVDISYKSKLTL